MNPNRSTGPSDQPVEVHTRTRKITLSVSEAHVALASAAMEVAGINPELNDARASVHVWQEQDTYDGGPGEMVYSVTITEDLSPIIQPPSEAPTDPSAFRLFGQPKPIIMAQIAAECETKPITDYWDGVVPRYPNNT